MILVFPFVMFALLTIFLRRQDFCRDNWSDKHVEHASTIIDLKVICFGAEKVLVRASYIIQSEREEKKG